MYYYFKCINIREFATETKKLFEKNGVYTDSLKCIYDHRTYYVHVQYVQYFMYMLHGCMNTFLVENRPGIICCFLEVMARLLVNNVIDISSDFEVHYKNLKNLEKYFLMIH